MATLCVKHMDATLTLESMTSIEIGKLLYIAAKSIICLHFFIYDCFEEDIILLDCIFFSFNPSL